jgi:thiamine biosynthesis lipoprotein
VGGQCHSAGVRCHVERGRGARGIDGHWVTERPRRWRHAVGCDADDCRRADRCDADGGHHHTDGTTTRGRCGTAARRYRIGGTERRPASGWRSGAASRRTRADGHDAGTDGDDAGTGAHGADSSSRAGDRADHHADDGTPDAGDDGSDERSAAMTVTAEVRGSARAMATDVEIRARGRTAGTDVAPAVDRALAVFAEVETACTRFDPASPLMRANAHPDRWHAVPDACFDALVEAHRAYERTRGRFDPRILGDLIALGYSRTLPFAGPTIALDGAGAARRRRSLGPWRPRFVGGSSPKVRLGRHPVDLGGIGKGLAVRWASRALEQCAGDYLIAAGGDCYCAGVAPDGDWWRVGVEDPDGSAQPVAVLALSDQACATSSTRVRRWTVGGRNVHHLVDPRTGRPGGTGLRAVTVVHDDPATAEVWSKVLFLAGRSQVAALAMQRHLAALWVDVHGRVGCSPAMRPAVVWEAA